MIALKDESVQKLGVVVIWDMMSEYPGGHDYEADRMAIQTVSILPVRPVARYFLYNSEMWDHVIDVLNQLNTAHARARTRSIKGSYDEVMQALACLGISRHSIPAKKNGEINSIGLNQWVEARKKEELSSTAGLRCLGPLTVKRHLHGRLSFGGPVKRRKIDM